MAEKSSAGSAIRTWAMTALAIVVVATLLLLVWKLRQTQGPTASRADKPQTAHESAQRPLHEPGPAQTRFDGIRNHEALGEVPAETPEADAGAPTTETADGPTMPLAELLARSSSEIRKAAATCSDEHDVSAGGTQKTEFDFIVVFKGGQASVEEVMPVGSDIEDKKLERCILDKVSKARWKTPKSSTFRKRWRQSISLADLAR